MAVAGVYLGVVGIERTVNAIFEPDILLLIEHGRNGSGDITLVNDKSDTVYITIEVKGEKVTVNENRVRFFKAEAHGISLEKRSETAMRGYTRNPLRGRCFRCFCRRK